MTDPAHDLHEVASGQPAAARGGGVAVVQVLVVAAHSDYEALALDELSRGGFSHASRLVTSVGELQSVLAGDGAEDAWDIALVIDTPDGPPAAQSLQALAAHVGEMPVIAIGRSAPLEPPPGLASLRSVDLRALAGAAAEALRELERRRERRRGAQALRASEIRFSTVFDSAPSGLALVRPDGRFLGVNPVFCAIAGRERDAIVAASPQEIADDDLLACVRGAALRAVDPVEGGSGLERRAVRADGTPVWVRVSASLAFDDAGEVAYVVAHVEDITAQREAETARRRSEAMFSALFDSTNVGMCVVDGEGRFTATNRAYQEILGYTGEELARLRFQDVTHPDDVQANVSLRTQRLGDNDSYRMEKRYVRKDGSLVWTELSGAPLDLPGPERLAIGAIVDITERKTAEALLEESARALETARMLGGLGSWVATREHPGAEPELTWSPEMYRILGLQPDGGAPSLALLYGAVHPDDRELLRACTAQALEGGDRFEIELRVVHPSGEVRWVRERADVFAGPGTSVRLVGVILDVTEARAGGGGEAPGGHAPAPSRT